MSAKTHTQTRQGALLRLALRERGVQYNAVSIDHPNGRSFVDGRRYGLIYPDSFFVRSSVMVGEAKTWRFFFVGHMTPERHMMLAPFDSGAAKIKASSWARRPGTKADFDLLYFQALSYAEFGLCPHHPNWPGPWDTLWTYRFIDCVMVGAIPVLFRATPLCEAFTEGFRFAWDDDAEFMFNPEDARHNRALAEERFRL